MAKFAIECPNCGKYAEAKTVFFARKKIDCSCGHTINVRTDKLASRECPHCGNMVIFDQSKGGSAKCPVCHEPINTMAEQNKIGEIFCAQCGIQLMVSRTAKTYICPVCDCVNDVAERLTNAKSQKDGLASIIKYEGDSDTLVWKHPVEDFNYGSQLIVHESQEAIFFRNGQALDLFGAGRYTLETQQLPMLEKVYHLPADTERTFHSEIYYINLATVIGIKWGTNSKVRMFDPASGLHIELGACGEFNIRVINPRKLLMKLVGTTNRLTQEQLLGIGNGKGYFRATIMTQVKSYLAQTIKSCGINILEIDERLIELSDALRELLNAQLKDYGLEMPAFYISRVITPDDDPNFKRLKEQYAEQYLLVRQEQIKKSKAVAVAERKAVEAETDARMKVISAQGDAEALKIQKAAEAEAYRIQAEAEAAEMHMKGYTYQQETARQVGLGATAAMANGGSAGGIGDIAGLGMALGAMGGVIDMTKDAMSGITNYGTEFGQTASAVLDQVADTWDCSCGASGISSNFCPNCGTKRPKKPAIWDCAACGTTKITSNFCPNCGAKKPGAPLTWDCSCGAKRISSNFCPNCGNKRGE